VEGEHRPSDTHERCASCALLDEPLESDNKASRRNTSDSFLKNPPQKSSMEEYLQAIERRRNLFRPSQEARTTQKGYSIIPVGAAPHGAQIHAMELSHDSSILLTGGSDGYVRWYDLFASMNGKNMLTQNLRNTFVEGVTKGGVLTTWWGHTYSKMGEENLSAREISSNPVHSLVCQKDALWGMSGCEAGTINLWGLRHAAGTTHHVFRKHTGPVSSLVLDPTEQNLVSGGWDRGVFVRG